MTYYMYWNCFNFNICYIRVKFELLNCGWIVGYIYIVMSIGLCAQVAVLIIDCYIGLFGIGLCRFCNWVELLVQRRLCQIFVKNVGSPDIH